MVKLPHELVSLLKKVENLIESANTMLKEISEKEYKPVKRIDLVRIIWDKCNSAFLAGKGECKEDEEKTKYWFLDQHEIELPFMIDDELFTELKVSAIVNPEGYFNFRLTLPGEETKPNLEKRLKDSEHLRDGVRFACSKQPSAPQNLA